MRRVLADACRGAGESRRRGATGSSGPLRRLDRRIAAEEAHVRGRRSRDRHRGSVHRTHSRAEARRRRVAPLREESAALADTRTPGSLSEAKLSEDLPMNARIPMSMLLAAA